MYILLTSLLVLLVVFSQLGGVKQVPGDMNVSLRSSHSSLHLVCQCT